jgi:hypothetical protein
MSITLLEKTYHGFEEVFDYYRDVQEVFMFPQDERLKKIKGDFTGKLKVTVVFEPDDSDWSDI